jgi:hypothetical protein
VLKTELFCPEQLDRLLPGVGIKVKELLKGGVPVHELRARLSNCAGKYYDEGFGGYEVPPGFITCGEALYDWTEAGVRFPSANERSISAKARSKQRDNMPNVDRGTGGCDVGGLVKPSYPPRGWQSANPPPNAGLRPARTGYQNKTVKKAKRGDGNSDAAMSVKARRMFNTQASDRDGDEGEVIELDDLRDGTARKARGSGGANANEAGPCPTWAGPAIVVVAILYVVLNMVLLYLFMGPR